MIAALLVASMLQVVDAIGADGEASALWLAMIQKRVSEERYLAAVPRRPLSEAEREWSRLIHARADSWTRDSPALAVHFPSVEVPQRVAIVLGNRGGEDAFTHDPTTIGFDVSRLHALYGEATLLENADRIDRLFRHEYAHLLQKAWLAERPYHADTPLRAALLGIWTEGLGTYYSLSSRWRGPASVTAGSALAALEPRFVARLAALACASNEASLALMPDLGGGAFERKWGALPAALWLERETDLAPDALKRFVADGPDGVWDLAARNASPGAQAVLRETRAAAALCGPSRRP